MIVSESSPMHNLVARWIVAVLLDYSIYVPQVSMVRPQWLHFRRHPDVISYATRRLCMQCTMIELLLKYFSPYDPSTRLSAPPRIQPIDVVPMLRGSRLTPPLSSFMPITGPGASG